jgi:hypothetical protein
MADDKKKSNSGGNPLLWMVLLVIIFLLIAVSFINRNDLLNKNGTNTSPLIKFFSSQNISEGEKIINKNITKVRQSIGGSIIGEQKKRAIGEIVEGPISSFGYEWFRIDYKKAPDGWVIGSDITDNVNMFRILNIVPILFSFLKPIGYILSVVIIVLFFFVFRKKQQIKQIEEKKKELEKEIAERKRKEKGEPKPREFATESEVGIIPGLPTNLPIGNINEDGLKFENNRTSSSVVGIKNQRWGRIEKLITSHNTSDWRQAIMEADIILEEMIAQMGYQGETLGDQMKQIEESDFLTLSKAWEAHKFRNHIAHKGGDFVFSKDEAERIIKLYKEVFEEFYYI